MMATMELTHKLRRGAKTHQDPRPAEGLCSVIVLQYGPWLGLICVQMPVDELSAAKVDQDIHPLPCLPKGCNT